jgi:M6 family metalloprotease-like protein
MHPRPSRSLSAFLLAALLGAPAFGVAAVPADDALHAWRADRRASVRARSLDAARSMQIDKSAAAPARFALLVIAVDFSDHRLADDWDPAALAPRLSEDDGQSLRHYFATASAGRCELAPVVAPLVRLSGAALDYSDIGRNGFTRTRRLATEALTAVAAAGFDFRLADSDGADGLAGTEDDDGWVDGVLILHAEAGQENDPQDGRIQALQYYLETPVTSDGVSAGPYAVASLASGPGIWAHETAHLLGMEDRYDPLLPPTDGAGDLAGAGGLGVFSLMAAGAWGTGGGWSPALPDAYSRAQLGWCDVVGRETSPAGGDTLRAAPAGAVAHRLWTRGGTGPEFFLLEARDPAAAAPFDAALPAAGLLVLHVDEDVAEGGWSEDGFQQWHLRTRLVEADGDDELHQGDDTGSAGDVFPGAGNVALWTPATSPDTDGYDGPSGVSVSGITSIARGVVYDLTSSAAPWLTFTAAFPPAPPLALDLAVRVHGGEASSVSALVEALGDPSWGAFTGGSVAVQVELQSDGDGNWTPADAPVWIAAADLPPDACTTFRTTLAGPGLSTLADTRPWCWTFPDSTLEFARFWPGAWTIEQPAGPGTGWQRWTDAGSVTVDEGAVLVCTGQAADPADWPDISYTNGGRARLTSGPLGAGVTAVRLVHWFDVETLPGGVPMDGAVASWIGPDGAAIPAEPLNGWPARVDATSGSALRGNGAFADANAERSPDGRPLWRAHVIPVPAEGPGPWKLRLDFAANDLWRARGWIVADCEPLTGDPESHDERPVWNGDLSWNWFWPAGPQPSPSYAIESRTLPDSTWSQLLSVPRPPGDGATTVPGSSILPLLSGATGTRHDLRVTSPTRWGILATAPVTVYVDGGAGNPRALGDPWPNPTAGTLRFTLQVPEGPAARLRIFDLRGRLVHERDVPPGTQFAEWDGLDDQGRRLPSGAYVLKLDGVGSPVTRKVVLRH